eukprot:7260713-Prymnesium_polylepis.1
MKNSIGNAGMVAIAEKCKTVRATPPTGARCRRSLRARWVVGPERMSDARPRLLAHALPPGAVH